MILAAGIELPDAAIAEICRRYEVKELAVFGSAARGEMHPDSDLDFLVEFIPEARVSLLRHYAAERELSTLLVERSTSCRNGLSGRPSATKSCHRPASSMRRERLLLEDILSAADAIAETSC